jgi:hypothetical protein
MKRFLLLLLPPLLPLFLLAGCLEVDQHPTWVKGQYAGKKDDRQFATHFHKDKLAWWGTISNRNTHQNEYNRANP